MARARADGVQASSSTLAVVWPLVDMPNLCRRQWEAHRFGESSRKAIVDMWRVQNLTVHDCRMDLRDMNIECKRGMLALFSELAQSRYFLSILQQQCSTSYSYIFPRVFSV